MMIAIARVHWEIVANFRQLKFILNLSQNNFWRAFDLHYLFKSRYTNVRIIIIIIIAFDRC